MTLQLHSAWLFSGVIICLLVLYIIDFMCLVQLYLVLIVSLLNVFNSEFALRKCFLNTFKKQFSNVGFYTQRKWWVKPYDRPFSLPFFCIPSFFFIIFVFIFQFFIKTTVVQYLFVSGFCSIKNILVSWNAWYSFINCFGKLFKNIRWMVWKFIDVNC